MGVANAVCFLVLFWQARLYGDMALQVLFIAICLLGWYRWLFGGAGHSRLRVTHLTSQRRDRVRVPRGLRHGRSSRRTSAASATRHRSSTR